MTATDTIDNNQTPQDEPTSIEQHHQHEGHDHDHDHDHDHQHGPTLNPACTREVEIEVPANEVVKAFRTVIKRYQKQARIPGFRAGKVPESLIRNRFHDSLQQDVVESIVPAHFRTAMEQQNLQPVSQPQVTDLHLHDGEPLRFKAVFEVLPPFSVEGYQDVKVDKPDTTLTDAEFDQELKRVIDSRSTMEPVDDLRPLADGDFAQITFKGELQNSEPQPDEESKPIEGQDVLVEIGGANTLPAFNEALRGAKPGQELKIEVAYPEDFGEKRLAGNTVAYDVTIDGIKKRVQPELNDDFAKELGDYESFDDFKQKLREHMASDKSRRLESETLDKLVEALSARFQVEVPESMVQNQVDARLDRGLRALAAQGMRTEDMRKLDFARLRAAQRDSALAEVKGMLLLDRIAEQENIEVTQDELDKQLFLLSIQTQEPVDVLRNRLTSEGNLARIREQIRREKAGKLLVDRLG